MIFYGRESFIEAGKYLISVADKKNQYCVMGYDIINTLVESGGTSRAECVKDKDNYLSFVEERTEVQSINGIIKGLDINKSPG